MIEVVKDRRNLLIGRREIEFIFKHDGSSTPPRHVIREKIASFLKVPLENIYIHSLYTKAGLNETRGHCHIYEVGERASKFEDEYIRIRNMPPEKRRELAKVKEKVKAEVKPKGKSS